MKRQILSFCVTLLVLNGCESSPRNKDAAIYTDLSAASRVLTDCLGNDQVPRSEFADKCTENDARLVLEVVKCFTSNGYCEALKANEAALLLTIKSTTCSSQLVPTNTVPTVCKELIPS